VRLHTTPGEWFWYRQPMFKPNIFLHIYLTNIAGIFAVFQFIPGIRRRYISLHRLNGYLVLILLIPGTVSGSIVARRSFGGELNVQAAFYILGLMIVSSALVGISNVKCSTRKHRKWMLRTVAYVSAPITARLATISARYIISAIGTYYSVWRCDEVLYVLNENTTDLYRMYPQCNQPGLDLGSIHVAVRAAAHESPLGFGSSVRATFGMALWIGMVIHVIGVELYIRKTDSSNQHRQDFVLGPKDEKAEGGWWSGSS